MVSSSSAASLITDITGIAPLKARTGGDWQLVALMFRQKPDRRKLQAGRVFGLPWPLFDELAQGQVAG